MALVDTGRGWWRRLCGNTARSSWEDRGAVALLLLGAVALAGLGGQFTLAVQLALWAGLLLAAAVLARRGLPFVFGPVFVYEVVRMARRRRYFWFRTLYVMGLFGLLGWVYFLWTFDLQHRRTRMRPAEMALIASSFFYGYMGIQYALVFLLTPIYTAGSIAEEKDRKTMEFILATDLHDHEIILGKWLARLGNLTLLVLAGLPILSFLQFLGGIDPGLLLAGFTATGLSMLSIGAVGMLCSVLARKPRDAIVLTYLLVLLYHAASAACWLVFVPIFGRRNAASVADLLDFVPWLDLVGWVNAGNIASTLGRLSYDFSRGGRIDDVVPGYLRDFALFHGLLIALCLTWAVRRVRGLALQQAYMPVQTWWRWNWNWRRWWKRGPSKLPHLPPIGANPVLWKEVYVDRGFPRMHGMFRVGIVLLVLGSFLPALSILSSHLFPKSAWIAFDNWSRMSRDMNVWVRLVGTGASCLLLLAVAVRAAGSISGERDKQTFDGLITTQLNSNTILFGKWVGSILSVRWGCAWLGAIWGLGLITGGLHPLGLPLLPVTWLLYAAVFATVGIWFSMNCATSLRATLWTLGTVVMLGGGHWLVMGLFCYMPLEVARVHGRDIEWLLFLELGQTPPAVLVFEALRGRDLEQLDDFSRDHVRAVLGSAFGLATWTGLLLFLWQAAKRRFRVVVCAAPRVKPS